MYKYFLGLLISIVCITSVKGQDFDQIISSTADTLAKKIVSTQRKTVAISDFINLDESITQLGIFLSEEVSSELSNLTDNQKRFRILERSKLDQIFKEKNLIQSTDGSEMAKELGKLDVADILIFATITDFNGYYRVVMKLLDTRSGDALSSLKVSFVRTSSLENLNKVVLKTATGQVETPKILSQTTTNTSPATPACETQTGTLSITNQWRYKYAYQNSDDEHKIVVRIPRVENAKVDNDYYYIILGKDETKTLDLKEGYQDYEARRYCDGGYRGWCFNFETVSSGQIKIARCKTTTLLVK